MAEADVDPHMAQLYNQMAQSDVGQMFPTLSPEEWKAWNDHPPVNLQYQYKGKSNVLDIPGTLDLPPMQEHGMGVIVDHMHPDLLKLPPEEYNIQNVPGHQGEVLIRKKPKPPLVG